MGRVLPPFPVCLSYFLRRINVKSRLPSFPIGSSPKVGTSLFSFSPSQYIHTHHGPPKLAILLTWRKFSQLEAPCSFLLCAFFLSSLIPTPFCVFLRERTSNDWQVHEWPGLPLSGPLRSLPSSRRSFKELFFGSWFFLVFRFGLGEMSVPRRDFLFPQLPVGPPLQKAGDFAEVMRQLMNMARLGRTGLLATLLQYSRD